MPDGGARAKARGRDEEIVGLERGADRLPVRMEPAERGAGAVAAAPGLGARGFLGRSKRSKTGLIRPKQGSTVRARLRDA